MTSDRDRAVLRLASACTLISGAIAIFGVAFLVAMFVGFAIGATATAMTLGWINDVLSLVFILLAAPAVVALHRLLRRSGARRSAVVAALGLASVASIVTLQFLLVVGALTFDQESGPVSIGLLAMGAWMIAGGLLGRSAGWLPNGGRMGLLGATYVGFPIWAIWMARSLGAIAEADAKPALPAFSTAIGEDLS